MTDNSEFHRRGSLFNLKYEGDEAKGRVAYCLFHWSKGGRRKEGLRRCASRSRPGKINTALIGRGVRSGNTVGEISPPPGPATAAPVKHVRTASGKRPRVHLRPAPRSSQILFHTRLIVKLHSTSNLGSTDSFKTEQSTINQKMINPRTIAHSSNYYLLGYK